jgi:hypothetical protein
MADSPHTADLGINPMSIIEKLVEERKEKERLQAVIVENELEWKKAANKLFGGPNGKLFIKYLLRMNGLFTPDSGRDMTKMLEDRGAKNVYLRLIRPYLTPELLTELETQR